METGRETQREGEREGEREERVLVPGDGDMVTHLTTILEEQFTFSPKPNLTRDRASQAP